jgi:SOS-response transcriptional repressor LexA/DNA-binding XRE family transcriptional regulator
MCIFFKEILILSNFDFSVGKRLELAREKLGFSTQKAFSERLGLKYQSYVNYEKGERSLPDEIKFMLFQMGINITWLVTGQGEPFLDKQTEKIPLMEELRELIEKTMEPKLGAMDSRLSAIESSLKQEKPASETSTGKEGPLYTAETVPGYGEEGEEYEEIPYVWDIAAGPPIDIDEDRGETAEIPRRLLRRGERYYAASVRGGSMTEAGIRDGDLVLIRCMDAPRDGAVQVVRYKNKSTLKLLREIEGKGWELHYRDGSGKVITCDSNEYEVQGEFIAVLPKNTVISSL